MTDKQVLVSPQGVLFGQNCWMSHEKITGYSADQLNSGQCSLIARKYMEWVTASLAAPAPADQVGGRQ